MKAIIMAGGMGTRLRPVTGDVPKPMAPLVGRPIMEHIIRRLKASGFEDICATLRYRAEDIMEYFGDGSKFGVKLSYRIEEEALGTAGGVKNCGDFYGEEDFLVISGDAACDFQLELLMQEHRRQRAAVTIALCRDKAPLRYGLALTEPGGRIMSFIEKPDWPRVVTDLVNTGIYVISPRAMEPVPAGQSFDFGRELFPLLIERGEKIAGFEMQGYWCDIGTPLAYYECCADALRGRLKLELPEQFKTAEGESAPPENSGEEGIEISCRDRAGLMGRLSTELMELGADYSDGIRLNGQRLYIHIRPSSAASALRLTVKSQDAELAADMLELAKKAVEETEREM